MDTRPAAEKAAQNMAEFMEHGPGLRITTSTWTVARDRTQKKVLRGGLGAMGVGQMWFDETDAEKWQWTDEPEWETAPETQWSERMF